MLSDENKKYIKQISGITLSDSQVKKIERHMKRYCSDIDV